MITSSQLEEFKKIMAEDCGYHFRDDKEALKMAENFLTSLEAAVKTPKIKGENKHRISLDG